MTSDHEAFPFFTFKSFFITFSLSTKSFLNHIVVNFIVKQLQRLDIKLLVVRT
jgi:hypothetical protein